MTMLLSTPTSRRVQEDTPSDGDGPGVRASQASFVTSSQPLRCSDAEDPNEPGISLCERERRWVCEWWPPE